MTEKKFSLPITTFKDGRVFIGKTIDDKPDGKGWLIDEPKYYGEFKNGLKHGTGRLFYNDGTKIVAEFKENKFHGNRKTYDPNKKVITMEKWDNNELIESQMFNDEGQTFFNKFKNKKMHGIQLITLKDGTPVQVMYENGEKVKHPNTGDVNGAQGDLDPEFLNENLKTYNHHKERMEKEIIWALPDEVTEQINNFINKKKN
tara:strand:- start:86 stop:691 length:606 start_codon:yes stop_codon:yes gene_type:complete